jgi:hypothetical protein
MFVFDIFRSFLPSRNPLGFGAADFVELFLTLVLVGLTLLARGRIEILFRRFAERTVPCMVLLALLPIALRLLLLAYHPVPEPEVSDDFSYLLSADTLRHFRLANPVHPMHRFFETFFVLQEPSYSSIYPLGQGIVLALGWMLFGHPWAGVLMSIGALCALCYWMLRAWVPPVWALLGGLLAVGEFGPISQWTNSYWGGAVPAIAGCLVFGAVRRGNVPLVGLGVALQILTRPFESIFLLLAALPFVKLRQTGWLALAIAPALLLTGLQNHAVSGSWLTLPYMVSRDQYGVPTTFTFQPLPIPHRQLTHEQQLDYEIQSQVHGQDSYFTRLAKRLRFYRFFFWAPLYLSFPFFLLRRQWWILGTIALFALGTNLYAYFYPHYIAALTCLFVLVAMLGLSRMPREGARLLLCLCAAHFLFWYGLQFGGDPRMIQYETWDAINSGDPSGRLAVRDQLKSAGGKHLVFVRYGPAHTFDEWVHNEAEIDNSRVIWARDLGDEENRQLRDRYPNRSVWLLEPDAKPVQLNKYP